MWNFLLDTAADSSSGTGTSGNPMELVWQIALIGVVIAAFYFLMIRPQKKQQREAEKQRQFELRQQKRREKHKGH